MINTLENYEYSKEWLIKEIIKTFEKEKKENKEIYVRVRKIDLLNIIIKFCKLNEIEYE